MAKILVKNKYVLIDDDNHAYFLTMKWEFVKSKSGNEYARARIKHISGKSKSVLMHRLVVGIQDGDRREVDHINNNTLDNRRENLRIVTKTENRANRRSLRGVSKYKGVVFDKSVEKWKASIGLNGKHINLGRFKSEDEAARAYDLKAIELYGDYAFTNFPKTEYINDKTSNIKQIKRNS